MTKFGYARVSTTQQDLAAQKDMLLADGCLEADIFLESVSSTKIRGELNRVLRRLQLGDELAVVRLDRLARSLRQLLNIVGDIESRGAKLRVLSDPVGGNLSTPSGRFNLQIMGSVAELERSLISERTKESLAAAKRRGRLPGNPKLKARDPVACKAVSRARNAAYMADVTLSASEWLPIVQNLRPDRSWKFVTDSINRRLPPERQWTPERLKRAVRRLVQDGLAVQALLGRASKTGDRQVEDIIKALKMSRPDITLKEIAATLRDMHIVPPRKGKEWALSTIDKILKRVTLIKADG